MKVVFLSVGEAFDELLGNNSHIIISGSVLLLDCGYAVPQRLWNYCDDPDFIDAVFISHAHADHYFGLPPLIVRMKEEQRKKPLAIICSEFTKERVLALLELGYKGSFDSLPFSLEFMVAEPGKALAFNEFGFEFAPLAHAVPNLGVRLSADGKAVFYSGDGKATPDSEKLCSHADLVIHEAYSFDSLPVHSSVKEAVDVALRQGAKCLALTHLNRNLRRERLKEVRDFAKNSDVRVLIPEPLDEFTV